jgi:hypothetical protein
MVLVTEMYPGFLVCGAKMVHGCPYGGGYCSACVGTSQSTNPVLTSYYKPIFNFCFTNFKMEMGMRYGNLVNFMLDS